MIEQIIFDSISATASIVFQASIGLYLCHIKLLDQEKLNYLSKLVEQIFTPCLIFSSFVQTLDMTQIEEWLIPMIIGCLSVILGMTVGYLANKYIIKDNEYESIIILGSGLAMTTNMQLNLSHTLRDYLDQISLAQGYESPINGEQRAVKYVMINTFINTVMRWTFAKQILINLKKKYEEQSVIDQEQKYFQKQIEMNDVSQSFKRVYQAELQDPIIRSTVPSPQPNETNKSEESAIKNLLKNPPFMMSLFSVIVCMIPPLREILIQEGSMLNRAIFQSCASVGHVILPLVLITLGGNLYISYNSSSERSNSEIQESKISKKTILSITIIRLLIMPFSGWITLYFFNLFNLVNDPVLHFITIVSNAVPPAINLLIISTLYFPKTAKEMSKVLLCGYSTNIITLPIVISIFFDNYFT
ncbi:transporter protein, (auxin efflux carrier), putative (macronuclear) [Tetrahymena thermophila SB210]|uniref:Transporter protein, (Auxin efflux carrier), putative n=1 Tax=Tetrahymena thermophila (strain SB210) TaxID=312017 RepID=Q22BE1_TETTS|nr:transporter protein, (auxin efflux carrier), putative [Tetrahymena thermophila SB210]EAR82614.2 transporter protein, (auxin efflux carrier), putative [Tetrahymena thermophila SB210]|eukprot:XP_001030277.2 transporter protein, (auxin efflux carrier), putative [Tetrahymena thermophila SB210]